MAMDPEFQDVMVRSVNDPAYFHRVALGRPKLHGKQKLIAESVLKNRVTVVPAAHAVGKSWGAASTALQWLCTRPDSKVITTSASNNQLVSVLWAAIKGAWGRKLGPLPGRITRGAGTPQRLEVGPEWFAIGFSADRAESFSGFHGDNILVIVDESSGVEQPIWDAIESLGYTSLLALGNPIRATGHFRTLWDLAEAKAEGYAGFHLTAFDSPHAGLSDADIKRLGLAKGLCSKTWIESARRLYGEGSIYWKTRVLAQFPDEDHDQLIPPPWVDRCILAKRPPGQFSGPRSLSLDISKGTGRDRFVAIVGDDLGDLARVVSKFVPPVEAANVAAQLSRDWNVRHDRIVYDAGGWAGSDMARYLEALGIREAIPYLGGHAASHRFKNKRTQCAWKLRQRLDPDRPRIIVPTTPGPAAKGWSLMDQGRIPTPATSATQPPFYMIDDGHWGDDREELLSLRYSHSDAKIALETKVLCQERLGRSPDIADCRIMQASLWSD